MIAENKPSKIAIFNKSAIVIHKPLFNRYIY